MIAHGAATVNLGSIELTVIAQSIYCRFCELQKHSKRRYGRFYSNCMIAHGAATVNLSTIELTVIVQ